MLPIMLGSGLQRCTMAQVTTVVIQVSTFVLVNEPLRHAKVCVGNYCKMEQIENARC